MPTLRKASFNKIAKPVQLAIPISIDSKGPWSALLRFVLYSTPSSEIIFEFIFLNAEKPSAQSITYFEKR